MSISIISNCGSTAIRATPPARRRWRFAIKIPSRADDLYIYLPSIRRIRRATTTQRCQTLAPSEFNLDDINSFNGKITDFNYKYLGDKKILANISQEHLPFARKPGDYLPLDEKWEVVDTYVLEITPKDPSYCYPRKLLHLNKVTFDTHWTLMWDTKRRILERTIRLLHSGKTRRWPRSLVGRGRGDQSMSKTVDRLSSPRPAPIIRVIRQACSASQLCKASCAEDPSSNGNRSR